MARIDIVPHVTAQIRVAGELATEFRPPCDKDATSITDKIPANHCYIEAKSGVEFCIEVTTAPDFKFPQSHDRFIVEVYIDGRYIGGQACPKNFLETSFRTITTPLSSDNGYGRKSAAGKLVFTPVTITSDFTVSEMLKKDLDQLEDLGIIRIALSTGRFRKRKSLTSCSTVVQNEILQLPEKAMKGKEISHVTSVVQTPDKSPLGYISVGDIRPFARFFFHYRSYQALLHEMVIPRTLTRELPTASVPLHDVLSDLSEEDIRRLAREKLWDLQANKDNFRVKREVNSLPRGQKACKKARFNDSTKGAIDLTEE